MFNISPSYILWLIVHSATFVQIAQYANIFNANSRKLNYLEKYNWAQEPY